MLLCSKQDTVTIQNLLDQVSWVPGFSLTVLSCISMGRSMGSGACKGKGKVKEREIKENEKHIQAWSPLPG